MNAYLTLVRRELASFFSSFTGYIIIALVAMLLGLSFTVLVEALNREATDMPLTDLFYRTYYFWIILLIATPVITMRTFALEKSSGTFETLMTTPVSDVAVVLAKFTGALFFYLVMWLPLAFCIVTIRYYGYGDRPLSLGPLGSTALGIFVLGALYIAAGCFSSAIARTQVIAAIIAFSLGLALFFLSFLSLAVPPGAGWRSAVVRQVSVTEHMQDFVRGVVDTRHLVFYAAITVLFLSLTLKIVESRRWK